MSNRKFSWNILSWLFFWKCEVCLSMDRSVWYVQLRIFINGSIFSPSLLEPMVLLPQQQPEIRNIPRSPKSKLIKNWVQKNPNSPRSWLIKKKFFSAMITWGKTFIIMSTRAASLYSFQASAFFAICSASASEKLGNKKKKRKISPQPTTTTTT